MVALTHQTFGITFGLLAILFLQIFKVVPESIVQSVVFIGLVLLGSLLPDLDTTKSKLGRKLWPISFLISLFVKHRTATHSLLFLGIVVVISSITINIFGLTWLYALGISVGTLSHIMGDWLTKNGVPFLYPFYKKRFSAPITFRTGSGKENIVCAGLFLLNILLFWALTDLTELRTFLSLSFSL